MKDRNVIEELQFDIQNTETDKLWSLFEHERIPKDPTLREFRRLDPILYADSIGDIQKAYDEYVAWLSEYKL